MRPACAAIRCASWRSSGGRRAATLCSLIDHLAAGEPARCAHAAAPRRITLDIDDTFDAVHGGQQLRLFNAHYDDYGFQPIVVLDGEGRFVAALRRPAKRPKGVGIRAFLRRIIRAIRAHWPQMEILVRADSHYACPGVLDWCEANRIDYVLGLAPTRTLRRHAASLEESSAARFKAAPGGGKVRRCKEFFDAARTSTAGAARRKTTSRPGKPIPEPVLGPAEGRTRGPTAPRAPRPPPTSSGCSCTPAPAGCCGACGR